MSKDGMSGSFQQSLDIFVADVDPATGQQVHTGHDEDRSRNTAVRIWLECGSWGEGREMTLDSEERLNPGLSAGEGMHYYDPDLDSEGDTFEEAIIALAIKVKERYGDYKQDFTHPNEPRESTLTSTRPILTGTDP